MTRVRHEYDTPNKVFMHPSYQMLYVTMCRHLILEKRFDHS